MSDHAAALDAAQGRPLVFRGSSVGSMRFWAYNLAGDFWTELVPVGAVPAHLGYFVAILDAAKARLLVHGGAFADYENGEWVSMGDIWAYDLAGDPMTELTPIGATPSARWEHGGALDATGGRFLIYGGYDYDKNWLDYNWAYNLAGNFWTELTPTGGGF